MRSLDMSNRSPLIHRRLVVVLCLLLSNLLVPSEPSITFAEGSKELNATGGRRPNLFWSTSFVLGGISGIGTAPIKVFAKAGETISLGSSAVGIGSGVINYRNPAGTSGTCGAVGLISNYAQEQAGPLPNTGGYTPCIITVAQTTAAGDGIWEIDFISPKPSASPNATAINASATWTQPSTESTIRAWDVTVRNAGGTIIPGRAFANNLPIYGGSFNSTDGISPLFFVQTRDGYLYRVTLKGVAPGGATFFANRKGFTSTTTGNSLYGSVSLIGGNPGTFASTGATVYNPNSADDVANNNVTHKIFFEIPASDLPTSAPSPKGTTWLLNPQTAPPTASNLTFSGREGTTGQAGTPPLDGTFSFTTAAAGNGYAVTIDLNNNGTYGDGNDRTLAGTTVVGTNTVYWDGLDRNGVAVAAGATSFNSQVSLFAGEVHFPFLDAENNYGGFVIERLTGTQTNRFQVFYDDTKVCAKGETTGCSSSYGTAPNPRSALAGVDSSAGAHIYGCADNNNNGSAFDADECFGDRRAIDTWVYFPSTPLVQAGAVTLKQADLAATIAHTPQPVIPGNQIGYTITVSNNGPSDVTGVQVSDTLPASISGVTWTCAVTTGSGACGAASGSGNTISTNVNLTSGAMATYTVIGTLNAAASGTVIDTVSLKRPNDVTDPNTTNNSATDTAAITSAGTVNGTVFNDVNGDGVQNNSEQGIGNVAVQLVNSSGTSVGTTTTAADGTYSFTNVSAGAYTVQETDPGGYTSTTANSVAINLPAGGTSTANFGDQQQGTISGVVFNDTNGNGVQDAGENGLDGVTVQLQPSGGGSGTSVTTANGGTYSFANVTAGSYIVQETDLATYTSVTPNTVSVSVSAGGSATANFGDLAPGTVAGTVFSDINGNGIQDLDEAGLNGVTVRLVNQDTNNVVATATSANGGVYSLVHVPVGNYSVQETDPAGYVSTTANTVAVTVASNGSASVQFGDQQQGVISGVVFNDANGDGQQNANEQGIQNVAISLLDAKTGQLLNTLTTDANGVYSFANVTAGSYSVQETDPTGYTSTTANSVSVSVPAGGSGTANFGDQQQGLVSGVVFSDLNGNGIKDADETGLGGVAVHLTSNGGTNRSATTAGDGSYSFANVTAGSYTVQETDPSGYTSITANTVVVNVPAGGSATADFGDQQQGVISGVVFSDVNGDGIQDLHENGLSGVTIQLTSSGGTSTSVTTAGDGNYSFTNVTAGNYMLQESDPAGYTSTSINTVVVLVPAGGSATANFGDQQQGTVSGTIFNDLNGNGTQDLNEAGLSGVTITLTPSGGAPVTTTTAGDGAYSFTSLTADNYFVQETDPAGYRSTTSNTRNVVVSPGGAATASFGDQQQGTVSGAVFSDTDGDGIQDVDENGLGGISINLLDSSGTTVATTTTAGNGSYQFSSVSAGNYTVQETDPSGYTSTTVNSVSVSVASGGSASANFGDQQQGTISGTVFSDSNGNGTQDTTENGLSGVAIQLLDSNGNSAASTTTLGNGEYSFSGVTAGNYSVRETDPSNYLSITSNTVSINLASGGAANANFGDQQQGTVTGVVFSDSNGNGVQDPNEPGLGGVSIQLVPGSGASTSMTTAGDGSYSFGGVTTGSYTVQETDPAGYASTTANIATIHIPVGGAAIANFGDQQQGTISGIVFSDINGDGFQNNGESGLGGVTVQLIDHQNNTVVATTTTAGDGTYRFDGVTPGAYTVEESDPTGYISTTTNDVPITLAANGSADASFGDQAVGTISGTAFNDVNGNGTIDSDERGIGGVTVALLDQNGGVVASVVTTSDGVYTFTGVKSGSYLVRESTPSEFVNTTVVTVPVTLGSGGADTISFGNQQQGSISGTVFSDVNGDGFQNNGETGLGGVTVQLLDTNNNQVASTTTTGDGSYSFANVTAGSYKVQETDPSGYLSTTSNTVPLNVAPNGAGSASFGDQQQGSISGVVFNDNNGDQRQDPNEGGLGGVVIQLVDANGSVVTSSTTASNGTFLFTGVTPGVYTLRETDPSGFGSVTPNSVSINLVAGGADTANFGDQQQGTIGGVVFNDLNGNGSKEVSELGIGGVTVQLLAGTGEEVAETTTNGDGTYTFVSVGAGSYTLRELDPAGFVSTTTNTVLVSVAPGGTANAQFGDQAVGSIAGTVFDDLDGNGVEAPNEAGIGGVSVQLVDAQANVVATQTTATDGAFVFTGVTAGSYSVRHTPPTGYVPTSNTTVTVSVPAGGAASAQFGDQQVGLVSGTVFDDLDGNGNQDNAELGIGGVAIVLVNPTDGSTLATATTAGDGTFLFTGVTAGSYLVRESDPSGYISTTTNAAPIHLAAGGAASAQFGDQQVSLVSGTVFSDLNTDGVQDQSEPGLSGVTVTLFAPGADGVLGTADDVQVGATTTVGDGAYLFTGITAGTYQVRETDPSDYVSTTTNAVSISLAAGGSAHANFGDQQQGTISGVVFNDITGDGAQDSAEGGLGGVTITLVASDGTSITTTTAGNGAYSFTNVTLGSYTVQETDPSGYRSTTGNTRSIFLSPGGGATASFGDQQQGTLSGVIFSDSDGDGVQDVGENGLGSISINLLDGSGTTVATTTTAGNGSYQFSAVSAGNYTVQETDPSGYTSTTVNSVSISVAPGGSASANFGDQQQGTISGTVFSDINGNGTQDVTENGIGGVTVELLGNNGSTIASTTTVGNGDYSFTNVTRGNYSVRESDPSGYLSTTSNTVAVSVATGGAANADFGDQQQGTVTGVVFSDSNGNGVQDPNETGVGGIVVQLLPSSGGASISAATAGDGSYSFGGVTPGSYTVQETDPAGYTSTTANIATIHVPVGGSATASFGDQQQGSISGTVFSDVNGDGFQNNGEPGLGGVTIKLLDQNNSVIATTATVGDGTYRFDGVTPGAYTVEESDPTGYIPTTTNDVPIHLGANGSADAPFGDQAVGTISGTAFNDVNGNGTIDSDERGIGGVTVTLLDQNGGVVANGVTTSDGVYTFIGVKSGTYLIRESMPSGFVNTTVTSVPVSLGSGDADTVNFGNQQQGSISGTVFSDANGDGFQNNGETGIGGVTVQLLDSNGNQVTSTTTVGDGSYSFAGVTAGSYKVQQTDPNGYLSTTSNTVPLNVAPNGAGSADFGDQQQGSISGVVFNDNNGDQVQDSNEGGLGSVLVQLADANGTVVASNTTTSNGTFVFTAVTPGTYTLHETDPSGFTSTTPNVVALTVAAGGADTANFGDQQQGAIGGLVFNDLNGNGTQEVSEPGIDGVTVQLVTSTGNVAAEVKTNGDGTYTFVDVGAGSYTVHEADPTGFVSTTSNTVLVSVAPGGTANAQFGDQAVGSVAGTVFDDLDGNGVEAPNEAGIGGVTVQLVDAQANVVATQTTATDGSFIFTGVPAGSYSVRQTTPTDYVPTTNTTVTVSVPAGGAASAQFGDQQVGLVSGTVFDDLDGNGNQDNAELGIGSVTITLINPTDGSTIATTTTAGDGTYLFTAITAGSYQVRQAVPSGYISTTTSTVSIHLAPGGAASAQFGDQQVGLVSGTVFSDLNTDGVQDQSEVGISGVAVMLFAPGPDGVLGTADDAQVASTTSVGDGSYIFTGVTASSYQVRETDPNTYVSTTTNVVPISVAPGGSTHANFGDQQIGTVSGIVFSDTNASGSQEPDEWGIGGVTVTLSNAGPDGTLGNADDQVIATTTTAGDGSYVFNGVVPGSYVVHESDPPGYLSTTSQNIPIYVAPNGAATANFGDQQNGMITGVVYQNANGGTVPDPNEPGLGGVTVQLLDANQNVIATTVTAGNGDYSFINVPPGTYTTQITDPSGYIIVTLPSVTTILSAGGAATATFGVQQVGTISGDVFNDINGDGVPDPDEEGLGGTKINLLDSTGSIVATTTTANDGSYSFTNVPFGSYTVQEQEPDGFVDTTPNTAAVIVGNGAGAAVNFGEQQLASISGEVFNDLNANKKQDPGEPGIGSVQIELLNANGVVVATTTSAGDGSYFFTGVAPGSYTVRETDPPAFTSTTPNTVATTVTPTASGSANFGDNVPIVPTAITLVSFIATPRDGAIEVRWMTSTEIDTWGFYVLCSSDGTRATAQRVTPNLILAKGRGQGGATYTWSDTSGKQGDTYWLQEVDLQGAISEYGPVTVRNQLSATRYQIWLPLIQAGVGR